jgi:hypothetical protein
MEVDCVMLMEAIVIVEGDFFLRDVLNFDTNRVMNDV